MSNFAIGIFLIVIGVLMMIASVIMFMWPKISPAFLKKGGNSSQKTPKLKKREEPKAFEASVDQTPVEQLE